MRLLKKKILGGRGTPTITLDPHEATDALKALRYVIENLPYVDPGIRPEAGYTLARLMEFSNPANADLAAAMVAETDRYIAALAEIGSQHR